MNNYQERILDYAVTAFEQRGVKAVTMDNIAHHLQISKRTLYQTYANKEALLLACVQRQHAVMHERVTQLIDEGKNVVEILLSECHIRLKATHDVSHSFLRELRHYPRVMAYLGQHERDNTDTVVAFLQRGVAQGLFLPGLNFRLIFSMMQRHMEFVAHSDDYSDVPLRDSFLNFVMVYFRGCATEKGIALIDDFLQRESENDQ